MALATNKAGNISGQRRLARDLTKQHILDAIDEYNSLGGSVESSTESTTYNLIFNNSPYPPKAIFDLAMSNLLGTQVVSSHFSWRSRTNFLTFDRLGFEIRLKDGNPWSNEEMRDSVEAYLQMLQLDAAGTKFNKAQIYRDLSNKFKRGAKSYEFRMQNISYVFELLGRSWVKGLKPKRNITAQQVELIENLIADIESKPFEGKATFEAKVRESSKKSNSEKPIGDVQPKTSTTITTSYARSPEVKAWVLKRAKGICECCNQDAPFETDEGKPFLEVHHIIHLVDGGADTVENCAGICPNCHRMLHFGKDRDAKFKLLQTKIRQFEA